MADGVGVAADPTCQEHHEWLPMVGMAGNVIPDDRDVLRRCRRFTLSCLSAVLDRRWAPAVRSCASLTARETSRLKRRQCRTLPFCPSHLFSAGLHIARLIGRS